MDLFIVLKIAPENRRIPKFRGNAGAVRCSRSNINFAAGATRRNFSRKPSDLVNISFVRKAGPLCLALNTGLARTFAESSTRHFILTSVFLNLVLTTVCDLFFVLFCALNS